MGVGSLRSLSNRLSYTNSAILLVHKKLCVHLLEPDPKTADWPMVATPWPTISLVAVYLFIVKQGPKVMENRKPFDLKWVLIIYNFALVLLSGYMVYEVRTMLDM